jgi:hypothetical protein
LKKVWITYAWDDNQDGDVDFIAQEINGDNIHVQLDRWDITSSGRLWEQIDRYISNPEESDAWIFIASQKSLNSEKCKEEYYYALERALSSRTNKFPLITIFLSEVEQELLPSGIKIRLYVSIHDPDWKERVISAIENRAPSITHKELDPFVVKIYCGYSGERPNVIEVRPRAGTWAPFLSAIPETERSWVKPYLVWGPKDNPIQSAVLNNYRTELKRNGESWVMVADNPASPTHSYYFWCSKFPSEFLFGVNRKGGPHYIYRYQNDENFKSK